MGTLSGGQISVTNRSPADMSVLEVRVETTGDFTQTNNCLSSSPLAVEASCTIAVIFGPTEPGPREGTIRIVNSFNGAVTGIPLRGMGIGASVPTLSALGPARLWIGLKNSDDVGLRVDVRAEVLLDGTVVGSGELVDIPTGSSGFNNAILRTIDLALASGPVDAPSGAQLRVRPAVRRTCTGGGHTSGTVRLWYNGQPIDSGSSRDAGSRSSATIGETETEYFLRPASALSTTAGTSRQFADMAINSSAACPSRPFTPFGTWSLSLP